MQHQSPAAGKIDVDDLNVGRAPSDFIILRTAAPQIMIAAFIMDRSDLQLRRRLFVDDVEQPPFAHEMRTEELADETGVRPVAGHGEARVVAQLGQSVDGVADGNFRRPTPIPKCLSTPSHLEA